MIKKLVLAAAVCIGSMTLAGSTSEAGDCYYPRGRHYAGYAYAPRVSVSRYHGVYRPPLYRYSTPGIRPYTAYRPGYGGYIGPSVRFGYPGYYGYGRGGIAIGIGF